MSDKKEDKVIHLAEWRQGLKQRQRNEDLMRGRPQQGSHWVEQLSDAMSISQKKVLIIVPSHLNRSIGWKLADKLEAHGMTAEHGVLVSGMRVDDAITLLEGYTHYVLVKDQSSSPNMSLITGLLELHMFREGMQFYVHALQGRFAHRSVPMMLDDILRLWT